MSKSDVAKSGESEGHIEKILEDLYSKVFVHAMSLGQEFPDTEPEKTTDPCNAEDVIKARAALNQLLESECKKAYEQGVTDYAIAHKQTLDNMHKE